MHPTTQDIVKDTVTPALMPRSITPVSTSNRFSALPLSSTSLPTTWGMANTIAQDEDHGEWLTLSKAYSPRSLALAWNHGRTHLPQETPCVLEGRSSETPRCHRDWKSNHCQAAATIPGGSRSDGIVATLTPPLTPSNLLHSTLPLTPTPSLALGAFGVCSVPLSS